MGYETEDCTQCNGSGESDSFLGVCSWCEGTGKQVMCTICGGAGNSEASGVDHRGGFCNICESCSYDCSCSPADLPDACPVCGWIGSHSQSCAMNDRCSECGARESPHALYCTNLKPKSQESVNEISTDGGVYGETYIDPWDRCSICGGYGGSHGSTCSVTESVHSDWIDTNEDGIKQPVCSGCGFTPGWHASTCPYA
jgi:hypothetical protein